MPTVNLLISFYQRLKTNQTCILDLKLYIIRCAIQTIQLHAWFGYLSNLPVRVVLKPYTNSAKQNEKRTAD